MPRVVRQKFVDVLEKSVCGCVFLFFSFLFFPFLFFSFLSFPFLSFPFLSFPFLSFPFLSFPFLSFFANFEIFSAMQLRYRSPWIRRCVLAFRDDVLSTSSRVKLSEINFWMLKIEDTTFPGNVGIRLPVSQRRITEELNQYCLIFFICGPYIDKIGWSEIWYFCCRDDMESNKSLPFVLGVQTQNVRETKRGFHN